MKVSILIPCYNSERFLEELFEGIHKQTIQFYEIICYDDFSADNTVAMAEKLGAIVIKGDSNRGPAFARNRLVEACKTEWFHFHDSDDLLDEKFNEMMSKEIETNSFILCNAKVLDRENRANSLGEINYSDILHTNDKVTWALNNIIFASMGLYSKSIFNHISGFDEELIGNEDPDIHIRLLNAGIKCKLVDQFLATKLEHNLSLSHQKKMICAQDSLKCLEKYTEVLPSKYIPIIGEKAIRLSNYFIREKNTEWEIRARFLIKNTGIKILNDSFFSRLITSTLGISFYTWLTKVKNRVFN